MGISPKVLKWRRSQGRGAIMSPKTFSGIEAAARRRGLGRERARKVAGRAYWNTVLSKYRKSR